MITGMKLDLRTVLWATIILLCGCASTLDLDGALAITPYHIVSGGRIVVEVRVNDQGPFHFALDTGASISIIFNELRNTLGLELVPGASVGILGLVDSGRVPLLSIGRLQVGREKWADPKIALIPGDTVASAEIDGILGIDFLRRYAVGFSIEDRVLRLYPPNLVRDRSYRGWATVPLELVKIGERGAALYFLEVEIGGQKVPALFDLGAGQNMMNWAAASSLTLKPARRKGDQVLSGILKSTPVVAQLNAREVTTASIRWRNETFFVADLEVLTVLQQGDGPIAILGSGLFSQRDFVIDFVRNRLLVKVAMDEVDESH